jgi:hypothetical protein
MTPPTPRYTCPFCDWAGSDEHAVWIAHHCKLAEPLPRAWMYEWTREDGTKRLRFSQGHVDGGEPLYDAAALASAVAAERERCALLCEAEAIYRYSREESPWPGDAPTTQGHKAVTAAKLAAAIRAQP